MPPVVLHDEVIDAALATAATLIGMEVAFISLIEGETYRFARVRGEHPGIDEGDTLAFESTLCRRMLEGAPAYTADATQDALYCLAPAQARLSVTSYVGVPIRDREGHVLGTLCGIDRGSVPIGEHVVGVLTELAGVMSARLATTPVADGIEIRRTPAGWTVGDAEHEESLTAAMVLADLLAEDLTPPPRPDRSPETDELGRLQTAVTQLEHALAARVVIEQAIGIVAERRRSEPRQAFDSLRAVARRSGRRVHDLAREVVRSAHDGDVVLPPELGPAR